MSACVACSSTTRVSQFHPQNDVTVNVVIMSQVASPVPAEVLLRDSGGAVLFRAITTSGFLQLPLDYRAIQQGDSIEARVDMGPGGYIGSVVSLRPGVKAYRLAIAAVGEFFPESGVVVK
jgi:hypothetical protein